MSMHSEPWLTDDKDLIQQIERELDAFEQAELAFRAQERQEREERGQGPVDQAIAFRRAG